MSSWVNIPAAFAMPVFFAVLSLTTAPMGRQRSYLLLIAFALATCFLGIVSEVLLTPLFRDLSGSTFEAVSAGFAGMAIPEQGAKVGGFWLWLVFVRDRQQRDAIVGAVSTAMLFEAMQNSIIFHDALSDAETWGQTVALRSLIIVSLSALSAFVIGIWTSLSLRQAFGKWAAYAGGAFFLVVATDGIWNTATLTLARNWDSGDFGLIVVAPGVALMLISLALKGAALIVGINRLRSIGTPLLWPPSISGLMR